MKKLLINLLVIVLVSCHSNTYTSFGIEILVPLSYNQQSDGTLDNLKKMFEAIIPYHIEYRITGVM